MPAFTMLTTLPTIDSITRDKFKSSIPCEIIRTHWMEWNSGSTPADKYLHHETCNWNKSKRKQKNNWKPLTRWFAKLIEFIFTLPPLEFAAPCGLCIFNVTTHWNGFCGCRVRWIAFTFAFALEQCQIPTNRWISWANYIDGSIVKTTVN